MLESGVPKDHVVHVRLTEEEANSLNLLATKLSEKRSRLLRKMIREFINSVPDLLVKEKTAFQEAVIELGALSRQLAQMEKEKIDENTFLSELTTDINQLKQELLTYLNYTRLRWVKCQELSNDNH